MSRRWFHVRPAFIVTLSLLMLVIYVGVSHSVQWRKRASGSKSTRILEDLRMIDAAVDQYAIESTPTPPFQKVPFALGKEHTLPLSIGDEEKQQAAPVIPPAQ